MERADHLFPLRLIAVVDAPAKAIEFPVRRVDDAHRNRKADDRVARGNRVKVHRPPDIQTANAGSAAHPGGQEEKDRENAAPRAGAEESHRFNPRV